MKLALFSLFAATCLAADETPGFRGHQNQRRVQLKKLDEPCIATVEMVQYDESERGKGKKGSFLTCETPSGRAYRIPSVSDSWIDSAIASGELVSGVSTMDLPGNVNIIEDTDELDLDGPPGLSTDPGQQRRLATTIGTPSVLVVRVESSDLGSTSYTEAQLEDSVFGTGDPVNLKSQYNACSHGKLDFVRATGDQITGGVTTVTIDTTSEGAVTEAIKLKFGVTSPGQLADHVMYCMPSGGINGIAYASVNSWKSVYNNQWCTYVSAQMHELGHNLVLHHAQDNGVEYGDQSGMMGYSYGNSNTPEMCFNAANFYQLGWFNDVSQVTINPVTTNLYTANLASFLDYESSTVKPIIVRIDNPNSNSDYYMLFNRKTSYNIGTVEGGNQVVIVEKAGTGFAFSYLRAKLSGGGTSYTILNFAGSGESLTVTVHTISLDSSIYPNGHANVTVQLGSGTAPPTEAPTTASPTDAPTEAPTDVPTTAPPTDMPTTAQPTDTPTTAQPTDAPTTAQPTDAPTDPPTDAPTTAPPTDAPTTAPPTTNSPTPQPTIACGQNKASCSSNSDCCSFNCKGGACRGNGRLLGFLEDYIY